MFPDKESKNILADAIRITAVTRICRYRSLISIDNRAPTNPPIKEPADSRPA